MKILVKLFYIPLFTSLFFSGCRILPPSDMPLRAGESLPQAEIAAEVAPPVTTLPSTPASTATATEKTPITTLGERSVKPRLSYTVSEGELLWMIAKRADIYGDPLLWPLLYQANRDQIKDPRKIYPGQILAIPRNVSDEEREKARNLAKKSAIFSPE